MNQSKTICNEQFTVFDVFFIKINNYQLNRDINLREAKDRYLKSEGKEKAAKYYKDKQEVLRKNAKHKYRDLSEDKKSKEVVRKRQV